MKKAVWGDSFNIQLNGFALNYMFCLGKSLLVWSQAER